MIDRCSACSGRHNCVPSDGNRKAEVACIGEAPGSQEDKRFRNFYGKAGQEYDNHYLPIAGLSRQKVFTCNAIHCLPDSTGGKLDIKREKDLNLLTSCASRFLFRELQEIKPRVVVPMGAFANYAIDPDINLELQHGIPIETSWGTTFPMYHPAGGIHEPKKMLLIRNDWIRLGKFLQGKLRVWRDEYPNPDYRVANRGTVEEDLEGNEWSPISCDTEIFRDRTPFCLTYSVLPGTGRLIKAEDKNTLAVFQHYLDTWRGEILFHNWPFDKKVVKAMQLRFKEKRIVDTMLKVFHLGNLPQGLKALAYRELGMKMKDFDDLVSPHSARLVLSYYRLAQMHNWPKPEPFMERDQDGKWKLHNPQSFNTKLKRFFTDLDKNPSKDPFKMWTENWTELHEQVEQQIGKWPGKCISYAPFDEVLYYACRDTDSLLRLWPRIKRATTLMRKLPQEEWMCNFN